LGEQRCRHAANYLTLLVGEDVAAFARRVQEFAAARIAEAERAARGYLGDVAALEPVARDELFRRLRDQAVLELDVRPAGEYAAGHIPVTVSLPHDQLAARLAEFPAGADIVAYCRGRYCVFTPDAVRLLRAHGFSARSRAGSPSGAWPGCPSPPPWRPDGRWAWPCYCLPDRPRSSR
jgi:rhodanese-related sulfurtransferase